MVIWRGWGILALIIPVLVWFALTQIFFSAVSEDTFKGYYKFVSAFSILIGALAVWFAGKKLNSTEARTLVDEKTGEKVLLKKEHSLFFIKMEYWAIPFAIFSLAVPFAK